MTITVALLHMKLKPLAKRSNLEKARKLIKEAALRGAKLVVLPSYFNIGAFYLHYPPHRTKTIARNQAEKIPGATIEQLSGIALENGVYIVAGPIIERAGPKLFLTTVIIAPNGTIVAKYRKIGVNGLDSELGISPGRQLCIFDRLPRVFGIMAEDDIYFPEIARSLVMMGATALIVSLRHGDDVEKVKLVLRARSIENNVPILAVGGAFETVDKYVEVPTFVVDPNKGVIEELREDVDTYMLVEVVENPENMRDIVQATMMAKSLSHIYCKIARETVIPVQLQEKKD